MIGILVVTHGDLGKELINSMRLIAGMGEKCEAMSLNIGDDIMSLKEAVSEKIRELDDGGGVLVLTDILGGSPFNVSVSNLNQKNVEMITGVNLPMLIQACNMRDAYSLQELVTSVTECGYKSIQNIREKLKIQEGAI